MTPPRKIQLDEPVYEIIHRVSHPMRDYVQSALLPISVMRGAGINTQLEKNMYLRKTTANGV